MRQRITSAAWMLLAAVCAGVIGSVGVIGSAAAASKPDSAKASPQNKASPKPSAKSKVPTSSSSKTSVPVFAQVGGTVITYDEYNAAFSAAARKKFYHGKAPEGGVALLQREVGDELVTRVLLLSEAKRRGLQPDQEGVRKTLESYEQRYAESEQWKQQRAQVLPALTQKFEETSLLEQLEKTVRQSAVPTPEQVAGYYAAHPDKFTEPEQVDLKVILLKVDPSSPKEVWEKAEQDAQDIIGQLRGGADFAELARARSGEPESAEKGGDLGYRHSGMLPDEVVEALGAMKPGDLSPPVRVLQGYTVLRLVDRKAPRLIDFDASSARAQKLLQSEQSDAAWKDMAVRLKKKNPPKIDESRYLPLPDPAAAMTASSVPASSVPASVSSAH